jgi:hypothetical protein
MEYSRLGIMRRADVPNVVRMMGERSRLRRRGLIEREEEEKAWREGARGRLRYGALGSSFADRISYRDL